MNRTDIHNQIDNLIQRLESNHEALKTNKGDRSLLEIDILRKLCIDLYEQINQLRLLNKLPITPEPLRFIEDELEENEDIDIELEHQEYIKIPDVTELLIPQIEDEPLLPLQEIEPTLDEEIYEEVQEPLIPEIVQVENNHVEIDLEPEEDELEPEAEVKTESETEHVDILQEIVAEPVKVTVVEKVSRDYESLKFIPIVEKPVPVFSTPLKPINDEKSVLEKVSEQQRDTSSIHQSISIPKDEKELLEKFLSAKIAKITNAIDISKRFELQNNLFGGDSQSYSRAVLALEEAETKEKALTIYTELASKYKWDKENELVQELKSFIYRKY